MSFEPSPEGVRVSCVSGDLHLPAAYLLYSGEAKRLLAGGYSESSIRFYKVYWIKKARLNAL